MKRPGGELASRPLHFIWIADCSGSMGVEGKIQALNNAIRDSIPHMQKVAEENPNAEVLVRAVKFGDGAQWHITTATPVADFKWVDLTTSGLTDMSKALRLVADQLKMPPMTDRALPPVLVLISDGQPTDDFQDGLQALMDLPWGKKAVRVAIAIGEDADHDVLQAFIGHNELQPLQANNAEQLVNYIKWVSTAVLKSASAPPSQVQPGNNANTPVVNVPIPAIPTAPSDASNVW
ncbi:MAG: tellurium resistance protein [Beggiatoa sp. IS2]|nr:MAG: tellurium resistance protein [Beggiatoa sp. IS2]